jgi:DnaD/phage-associated family protein
MSFDTPPQGFERDQTKSLALPADFLRSLAQSTLDREGILMVLTLFDLLGTADNLAVESSVLLEAAELLFNGQKETCQQALEQAIQAGFILSYTDEENQKVYYLPGTPQGRKWHEKLTAGQEKLVGGQVISRLPLEERPNIYKLYEANIGPLTPIMAEMLKEDEAEYPYEWIEDAVAEAVERNKRSWRYVRAILNAWKERGRDTTSKQQEESIVEEYRRLYQEQRKRRSGKSS